MIKKFSLAIVLVIAMSLMLMGCGLFDFLGGGGGGSTPPKTDEQIELEQYNKAHEVGTAAELLSYEGSSVKLTADIVLSEKKIAPLRFEYFFGENFTIKNATVEVETSSTYKASLFFSSLKLVKDLKLDNLNVTGSDNVGGIASNLTGKIINCEIISGAITATIGDVAGGFAGTISGKSAMVKNLKNGATVTGKSMVGGIAGVVKINSAPYMVYEALENSGTVEGYEMVGGIFGSVLGLKTTDDGFVSFSSEILQCKNSGNISASAKYAGGIVAHITGEAKTAFYEYKHLIKIIDSSNSGSVSSEDITAGGIVGYGNELISITGAVNSGSVEGMAIVGGIAGEFIGKIISCESTVSASVSATGAFISKSIFKNISSAFLGGIVGVAYNIENCVNLGSVTYEGSANYVGGVVGIVVTSASSCVNKGSVSSKGNGVGGIAGGAYFHKRSSKLVNLENKGNVTAGNMVGGLVGEVLGTQGSAIGEDSYDSSIQGTNSGTITGLDYVGGLVGKAEGEKKLNRTHKITITGSNTGSLVSSGIQGDIVGQQK